MIKTDNLCKAFRTEEVETMALNKVNIEIEKGEFVAIMGPSGCGKSTLLNTIGLLDNPTDGKLYFNDLEVSGHKESQHTKLRKGNIGFIFQSFNLIDELNVFENVELPLLYLRTPGNERKKNGQEVMKLLGELNNEGATILMVTHSPADAETAQRVIHLFDGQVANEMITDNI